jgi:hypothetical protein
VYGHRQVNHQLMMLTDEYINFKKKANEKYVQMSQVIERQKHEHQELLQKAGTSPYMGTLLSQITTGNMQQYDRIADTYPDYNTPTISGLSTPARTQSQMETHLRRLSALSSVPPPQRLLWLDKNLSREVLDRRSQQNQQMNQQCPPQTSLPIAGRSIPVKVIQHG